MWPKTFATVPVVEPISFEELDLAARNHGMPLEALRYPVTPLGLHYLLTHYDIPAVDPDRWRLRVGGLVRRPLELTLAEVPKLIADGTITGGMIPKVESCVSVVEGGVEGVVIVDGRVPHCVLLELFTPHGLGTRISRTGQ